MHFLTRANHDLRVIYATGLLRSTGVGLTGVLLGVYLSRAGFSTTQIGIVITAGLAASALGTLVVSLCADRLGALGAGLPLLFERRLPRELLTCYRITFGIYAAINALTAAAYFLLSPAVEVGGERASAGPRGRLSPQSRAVLSRLAALSGIDSLGGGFLTDALLAYWFFHRFGLTESSLGLLFAVLNLKSRLIR